MSNSLSPPGNGNRVRRPLKRWRPGIQVYLVLMNLILLGLLFPVASFVFLYEITSLRDAQLARTMTQMRQDLERRGTTLSQSMALSVEQAIAGYDFSFVNSMMQRVVSNDREILYCLAMNGERQVLSHNELDKVGSKLDYSLDRQVASLFQDDFSPRRPTSGVAVPVRIVEGIFSQGDSLEPVLEVVVPLYNGDRLWAVLRCGLSLAGLKEEMAVAKRDWTEQMGRVKIFLLSMSGGFFVIGVMVAARFTHFFVRSTQTLSAGVRRIAEGELEVALPSGEMFCAEFVHLALAINRMTEQLRASYHQLDNYSRGLEQKVDERTQELRAAQAELVQQAHEAGMAEMAVGILHNIGNAITPAKVGAGLCLRRLQESPLRNNLEKAMLQLRELIENPAAFPEKEKHRLSEIAGLLASSVRLEFDAAIGQLEEIRNKHEHIEGIIGLQMRYARLFGDNEEVVLNQVTEDALKMLGESLRSRGVRVETEFSPLPPVNIEKAKLLQVIINLIKNGYEAMEEVDPEQRWLRITTGMEAGDSPLVLLRIRDHGAGITPGEVEKIFKFGYTTKKSGSGFGLHSCATYLMANHGSITVESEGPGQGCEFVVRLPAVPSRGGEANGG